MSTDNNDNYRDRSPSYARDERASPVVELTDSDGVSTHNNIRSTVHTVDVHHDAPQISEIPAPPTQPEATAPSASTVDPVPSTSQLTESNPTSESVSLPGDILDALGESKEKPEVFGPMIPEEISKRWGRILCEGLNKDQKKALGEKICVPENFQLVKAPKLNPEISAVLIESTRNRDKRLEAAQNYLGLGISAVTALTSSLIEKDMDKMDIIKRLSETNQILLDLHFENTINRRKLITYTLDKKFQDVVQDVKRDKMLFGENLTEKIKASQSAERSGRQMKKADTTEASTSRKPPYRQGNWRGPPRHAQRGNRQGGTRNQPAYRSTTWKRPTTASHQYQDRSKEQRPKPQLQSKQ